MYEKNNDDYKLSSAAQSSTEDSDVGFSDNKEMKYKNYVTERRCTSRGGRMMKDFVYNLSVTKSQSISSISENSVPSRHYTTGLDAFITRNFAAGEGSVGKDVNKALTRILSHRRSNFMSESKCEIESKANINSLISIMISTIMCLASNYPIPKSNIQATKIFLRTIVNENGESPRNTKGLMTLLNNYNGPYEGEPQKPNECERPLSRPETFTKTTEVILDPVITPKTETSSRLRPSRTRSRLPSLSPVKRNTEQKKN